MPLFDLWLMTTSRGRNRSTTYQLFSSLKSSERGQPISIGNTALNEESLQEGATDKDSSQKEEEKI